MEGEQVFNIPLDSNLDVNMADMLVPAAQPLFEYNRQKYLGGVLQTSVRFEADGWFAGWWQHNFVLVSTGINSIQTSTTVPSTASPEEIKYNSWNIVIYPRITSRGVPYYTLKRRDDGLQISFIPETWKEIFTGSLTKNSRSTDASDNLLSLEGKTQGGDSFKIALDLYEGTLSETPTLPSTGTFYHKISLEDSAIHVIIDRELAITNDYFDVNYNTPLVINDNIVPYTRDDAYNETGDNKLVSVDIWGRTIENPYGEFVWVSSSSKPFIPLYADIDGIKTSRNSGEFSVVSGNINTRSVVLKNNTLCDLIINVDFVELWSSIRFVNAQVSTDILGTTQQNVPANLHSAKFIDNGSTISYKTNVWYLLILRMLVVDFFADNDSGNSEIRYGIRIGASPQTTSQSIITHRNLINPVTGAHEPAQVLWVDPTNLSQSNISSGTPDVHLLSSQLESTPLISSTITMDMRVPCVRLQLENPEYNATLNRNGKMTFNDNTLYTIDTGWRPLTQDLGTGIIGNEINMVDSGLFFSNKRSKVRCTIRIPNNKYSSYPKETVVNNSLGVPHYGILWQISFIINVPGWVRWDMTVNNTMIIPKSATAGNGNAILTLADIIDWSTVSITANENEIYTIQNKDYFTMADSELFNQYQLGSIGRTSSAYELIWFRTVIPEWRIPICASTIDKFSLSPASYIDHTFNVYPTTYNVPQMITARKKEITVINGNTEETPELKIVIDGSGTTPQYEITQPPYIIDSEGNKIQAVGAYPIWMKYCDYNSVTSSGFWNGYNLYSQNNTCRAFILSEQTNAVILVKLAVTLGRFISAFNYNIDWPRSPYNTTWWSLDEINPRASIPVIQDTTPGAIGTGSWWRPNAQTIRLLIGPPAKNEEENFDFIDIPYHYETGFDITEIKVNNSYYSLQYVSFPAQTDNLQRIVFKLKDVTKTLTIMAKPTTINTKNGFVANLSPPLLAYTQVDGIITLDALDGSNGMIDIATNTLYNSKTMSFVTAIPIAENYLRFFVNKNNSADIRIIPQGIFQRNSVDIKYSAINNSVTSGSRSWHRITMSVNNTTAYAFIDKSTRLNLRYMTKDIRNHDRNIEMKRVYQSDLRAMFQFVKQFWSPTVMTENYWWINKDYVLELTREEMILWEKVKQFKDYAPVPQDILGVAQSTRTDKQGVVTDWMGDEWRVAKASNTTYQRVSRYNFFGVDDIYYGVSNAKDTNPVIYKIQAGFNYTNNYGTINVMWLADILGCDFNTMQSDWSLAPDETNTAVNNAKWRRREIIVRKVDFGQALRTNEINAYVDLNPAAIIAASKISTTRLGKYFLLGIAYSRGLLQWTIVIDTTNSSLVSVVNGYGHVGIDGSLTGGQIPALFCGANGFSAIVRSISELENIKGFEVKNAPQTIPTLPVNTCYGTGSKVWFIAQQVNSIVSHFTCTVSSTSIAHKPQQLALTNKVERRYESASFQGNGLFDIVQPPLGFGMLFESIFRKSQGIKLIADILLPVLFYIDLKYVMICYINHTFGQYCYVYRNSNKDYLADGKTDQDIKFLQDTYTVTLDQSADETNTWVNIILKAIEFVDQSIPEFKVNKAQNQTSTDDAKGRKFSQFFVENVANTIDDMMVSSGFNITLKSTLAQSYTLDMFYSISDDTQCYAGPGFVNHNFIGQCIAQAATDTQVIGKRVGYWCTLKKLSEIVVDIKVLLFEAVRDALSNLANGVASNPSFIIAAGTGIQVPLGPILAIPFRIAAAIMDSLIIVNKEGVKVIEQLADAIGPSTGKAYHAGSIQKYDLSIEGTHTYGNKPMSFFWPAYGITTPIKYTNEWVEAQGSINEQNVSLTGRVEKAFTTSTSLWTRGFSNDKFIAGKNRKLPFDGPIKNVTVLCKGISSEVAAPDRMAVIEGCKTFLSPTLFKNEQIGVAPAVFPPPPVHDYEIDVRWKLGFTAAAGEIVWVSCDDTKIIDGPPSNIVINTTANFCGVASSYIAIEIKNTYDHRYLRPWAVTPQAIALNINKMNCVQDTKVYHAFDGQGNRIIKWAGGSGMDKAVLYQQYQFQVNDHFKRSNILPPSQFFGVFEGPPSIAMRSLAPGEPVANLVQSLSNRTGIENEIPGEQKNLTRFSIPVHSDQLSTLPAMVRMLAPYKLHVVEGITSLTTDVRTTQTRYKAPSSIDFNIYSEAYRATEEYLCKLTTQDGIVAVQDIVPTAGLKYIGATTKEAFFFSNATRMYYSFADGREIQKIDVINRFNEVFLGIWDFVNQEVMFKAQEAGTKDTLILRLDHDVKGEVFPPNETIYNPARDYKVLSMAGGTVFQGPRRFIVNRFTMLDDMLDDIWFYSRRWRVDYPTFLWPNEKDKCNWVRVSRDYYDQYRNYRWRYINFDDIQYIQPDKKEMHDRDGDPPWWAIQGWTHNPYGLVTAMLGVDDNTDCKFEWTITFAWTLQMDRLYAKNEYVTVSLQAETVTQGGTLKSDPTHLYLYKELFTRSGNAGYYTFRYQSNNGIGNRERLYIWSDGIIAIQDLKQHCKDMTTKRTQPLVTQVDVQTMTEF